MEPETLPEGLIMVHIMFRRNSKDGYYAKFCPWKKEFKIAKGDTASYIPIFDEAFDTIISSYSHQLQQFVGERTTR